MKIKNLFVLGMFLVAILALSGMASAVITVEEVKLDGDVLDPSSENEIRSIEKGDEFNVKVKITSDVDVDDVQIEAYLRGYDHDDRIEDITSVFDMKVNRTYIKTLTLKFPKRMDQAQYTLRVEAAGRAGIAGVETYDLDIETGRHDVAIKDVIISPANGVKAGRALLATVRLQNYGADNEDDVRVTFSIPELGVSASDYVDEIEGDSSSSSEDTKSTEELYLRIPACVDAGEYDAVVEVRYHDGDKTARKEMTIEVFADDTCEVEGMGAEPSVGKTIITIGPESQDVTKGAGGVIYPVTITNTGKSSKTYAIGVTGGDWGTFSVKPTNVVTVSGDETKTIYIYASATENAPAGSQVFGVEIKSGDKTVEEVTLKANVVDNGAGSLSLKRVLELGLIVLVVILVILALIIGFNKLKGNDEDKEEGESYY